MVFKSMWGNLKIFVVKAQFYRLSYLSTLLLEEFGVYLLADDLSANVIFDGNAKPHLFQDKLHLLLFLHGAIRFHLNKPHVVSTCHLPYGHFSEHSLCKSVLYLQLLENGSSFRNLSILFFDIGQSLCESGPFNLYIDLSGRCVMY